MAGGTWQAIRAAFRHQLPRNVGGLNFLGHHKCASIWLRDYLLAVSRLNHLSIGLTHLSRYLPNAEMRFMAKCILSLRG
jgi:hypothetical protein